MATHPYISGAGNISQMIGYLRKNFPSTVTSETVKKFAIAPNNESYVINALQFIGIIDADGKRTDKGHDAFVLDDISFKKAFEGLIRDAYKDLFEVRGDDAWLLSRKELTAYFRTTDKTSEAIGGRQAGVFQVFRVLAGREQPSDSAGSAGSKASSKPKKAKPKVVAQNNGKNFTEIADAPGAAANDCRKDVALTVRIEINLPANGTQETYDNIFKSIRANLINE